MNIFFKNNSKLIIGIIIGGIFFGGMGFAIATSIASSTVAYMRNDNINIENVEDALDDLYEQIIGHPTICYNNNCGKLSYRYWNDNFGGTSYTKEQIPTTTYATRELLAQNYGSTNFENRPYYIRSVLINNTVVGHEVCVWNSTVNRELCFDSNYWKGTIGSADTNAGTQTKITIQRSLQYVFQITLYNSASEATNANATGYYCGSSVYDAHCKFGVIECDANYSGYFHCYKEDSVCKTNGDGSAYCDD